MVQYIHKEVDKLEEKLYTAEEIAEFLGCARRTVYNYVKNGMPKIQYGERGTLLFKKDEVLKWLKESKG